MSYNNVSVPTENSVNSLNNTLEELGFYVNPIEAGWVTGALNPENYSSENLAEAKTNFSPIEQTCDDDWKTQDIPSCSFQDGLNWLAGNDSEIVSEEAVTEKPANQVIIIHNYTGEVVAESPRTSAGTGTQLTLPSGESASGIAFPILIAACICVMTYGIGKMVVSALKSVSNQKSEW